MKNVAVTMLFAAGLLSTGCSGRDNHQEPGATKGGEAASTSQPQPPTGQAPPQESQSSPEENTASTTTTDQQKSTKSVVKKSKLSPTERKAREAKYRKNTGGEATAGGAIATTNTMRAEDQDQCISQSGGEEVYEESISEAQNEPEDLAIEMEEERSPATVVERSDSDVTRNQRELVCGDSKHKTPVFLREDIAYSVMGVDCYGDAPYTQPLGSSRIPASATSCKSYDHPPFLRADLAYGVTGVDCWGSDATELSEYETGSGEQNK